MNDPNPLVNTGTIPRVRPWATVIGSVGLAILPLLTLNYRPVDDDLWLHLRVGAVIADGRSFGLPDPLVALADRAYVPTQWLAEVAMTRLYDASGLLGVSVVRLLLIGLLALALAGAARLRAPIGAASPAAALLLFCTAAAWGERPQLAGLVCFAVAAAIWARSAVLRRAPWRVLFLAYLWPMVHGTWVLGVALAAAYTLRALSMGRPRPWRYVAGCAGIGGLSFALAAATPLGLTGLTEPWAVAGAARMTANEWQPPAWDNVLYVLVLAAAAFAAISALRRRQWDDMALSLAAAVAATSMVRLIAVGAVLLAGPLAAALVRRGRAIDRRTETRIWLATAGAFLVLGGYQVLAARAPSPPVPATIASGLRALPDGSVVDVDARVVGWVQWHDPHLRVLKDLRAEVYSPATVTQHTAFVAAEPGWQKFAADRQVVAAVVEGESALRRALAASGDWRQVAAGRDGQGHLDLELWVHR